MSWQTTARAACMRYGFPPGWVEEFAAEQEVPEDPRRAAQSFEGWALRRLTRLWSGEEEGEEVSGRLAAYLVQRYLAESARVLAYRYRLAEEEWEDLVAAAAERSLRVFSERTVEAPQPYLYRTIQRAVWEYLRKARREVATSEMPTQSDPHPDPEKHAQWRQVMTTFKEKCYAELSDMDRQLIEALELEGLSASAAGRPLGLGANAVNVRKFRIRKKLKDCLRKHTGLEDPLDQGR